LFLPSDSMVLHHSVIVEKPMGSAIVAAQGRSACVNSTCENFGLGPTVCANLEGGTLLVWCELIT